MKKLKNIKSFTLGLVVGLLIATGATVFATTAIRSAVFNDTIVIFNGEELDLPMPLISVITEANPYGVSNYMPVRAVLEAMGYVVDWDGERNAVIVNSLEDLTQETQPIQTNEQIATGDGISFVWDDFATVRTLIEDELNFDVGSVEWVLDTPIMRSDDGTNIIRSVIIRTGDARLTFPFPYPHNNAPFLSTANENSSINVTFVAHHGLTLVNRIEMIAALESLGLR